jgi:3-oxoacyl-[acyl-carrier-protein] synthase III
MTFRSFISGHGSYLPPKIVTNDDLTNIVDTSDEWIFSRTGIKQRHISEDITTTDMAVEAANKAITNANISSSDIDMIIVATTTANKIFPSVACQVQERIGANDCAAFDVQAVCAGFIYILNIADNAIKTGQCKNILIIGAESMSKILNWQDRTTCVLFGDGAGAVILSATEEDKGIIDTKLAANGKLGDILYADSRGNDCIIMSGAEVFKNAINKMSEIVENILANNNLTSDDIDIFIPHQANVRILDGVAKKLNLSERTFIVNTVAKHANTSAASIPLAIDHYLSNHTPNKGDNIILTAFGAGLCWGASLIKW